MIRFMSDLPPQPSPLFGPGRPSFDVVLRGYDQSTVDALVDRLRSGGPAVTPQELRGISFEVVLRGYDQAQVDAFIAEAAARLEGGAVDAPDGPPTGSQAGPQTGQAARSPARRPNSTWPFADTSARRCRTSSSATSGATPR